MKEKSKGPGTSQQDPADSSCSNIKGCRFGGGTPLIGTDMTREKAQGQP